MIISLNPLQNKKIYSTKASTMNFANHKSLPNDSVHFSKNLKKPVQIVYENLSMASYQKRVEALSEFNSPGSPLLQHITNFYASRDSKKPFEYFKNIVTRMYQEQTKTIAQIVGEDRNARLIVAKDSRTGENVGIGALIPSGKINDDDNMPIYALYNLCVKKEYQGQGIAKRITEDRLKHLESSKIPTLVYIEASSDKAKRMALSRGFNNKSEHRNLFMTGLQRGLVEDWFVLKEYNLSDKKIESINVIPHIIDAWERVWPDWKLYD